ncbi:MAG TPA: ATP-binding protein, partial [Blastocatellia bacterium]
LQPYQEATAQINDQIAELRQLTQDNQDYQARIPLLEEKINNRLDRLALGIGLKKRNDEEGINRLITAGVGKRQMDDIREIVAAMQDEESALLQQRAEEESTSRRNVFITFVVAVLLNLALLFLLYYLFRRDILQRQRVEEERKQLLARAQAARAQAETANRTKDEFLATVSHELRTPLNAMLGWARILRTSKLDEETTARALEAIERNAQSQAKLIEDLLDVSRIITGKMRVDVAPVDLASVIEAALDTVRPAARAKEIRLEPALDPAVGPVPGDGARLQQVIWNLLSNAVKFTPRGGRVEVRLQRLGSYAEITVSDTGHGIKQEFLPYIFERFRQADSSISRAHSGLGLGLAIVRHLVELHGGRVSVASGGEGQGATFKVKLPIAIAQDSGRVSHSDEKGDQFMPAQALSFECHPALRGLRVLVVDDDLDARTLFKSILERCGAEIISVSSADEAHGALESGKPDIVVSDIGMPVEDGYAFIRKVRAKELREQDGRLPAVALTAHARIEDRLQALSAGYQAHLAKPVEPAELVAVIASLVLPKA